MILEKNSEDLIKEKRKLFSHYYDNFEKHLASGNISKASEFLWGAISSLIYAIGITYREKVSEHRKMIEFAKRLSEDLGDASIYWGIKKAARLHANFYHNFYDKEDLEKDREELDILIKKLGDLLGERLKD